MYANVCDMLKVSFSAIHSKSLLSLLFFSRNYRIKNEKEFGTVYAAFWQYNVQKQTPSSRGGGSVHGVQNGRGKCPGGKCLSPYVKCRIMKRINNAMTVEN